MNKKDFDEISILAISSAVIVKPVFLAERVGAVKLGEAVAIATGEPSEALVP